MSQLFRSLKLRELEFRNRIFVSPMCQYSCVDGVATNWHLVHLGSRAVGGAGLVMAEASSVSAIGRISPGDLGIWNRAQADALRPVTEFIRSQGSVPAIQLAHAGRKASTAVPWSPKRGALTSGNGGWNVWGPSAIPFDAKSPVPKAMTADDLEQVKREFVDAAGFARDAGFQVIEIHMAHGYLLHEFLSPLSNRRGDVYGGSLENRCRYPLEVAKALRSAWPAEWPVFARLSATDWVDGGWDLEQSIVLSKKLKEIGIDLIDCSSGGTSPDAKITSGPGYQVPFAAAIRERVGIATGAVGLITEARQAETILTEGSADVVFLARELLRNPYWPLFAAQSLGEAGPWPKQYERAKPL